MTEPIVWTSSPSGHAWTYHDASVPTKTDAARVWTVKIFEYAASCSIVLCGPSGGTKYLTALSLASAKRRVASFLKQREVI